MVEIPLFPLNTVLFPGIPLHLHIFEERYKLMLHFCLNKNAVFGVVLIRKGHEAMGGLAEPYEIGCTAHILQVNTLSDGRMDVLAQGGERFRILSLDYRLPYLIGQIERLPMPDFDPPDVDSLLPIVKEYIEMLNKIMPDDLDIAAINFPDDPMINLNLSASVLQLPDREKQDLLSLQDSHDLYQQLMRLYKRELSVFNQLRDVPKKLVRRLVRLN